MQLTQSKRASLRATSLLNRWKGRTAVSGIVKSTAALQSAMKQSRWIIAPQYVFVLLLGAAFTSRGQALPEAPPWKEEMANGYFPYHRLAAADFPVNDRVKPEYGMYTGCFFITGTTIVGLYRMAMSSTESPNGWSGQASTGTSHRARVGSSSAMKLCPTSKVT
jgi:hypothetical protein